MTYLYSYLGLGAVTLIIMYVAHKWNSKSESKGLKDILDAMSPERKKLSYRIINNFLVPVLAAVLILFVWPIAIYIKIKDMRDKGSGGGYEEKVFKVLEADLLVRNSIEQIESSEIVSDPLAAVPQLPFGHLNKCWVELTAQLLPGDELWSFKTTWDGNWGRKEILSGYAVVREGTPESRRLPFLSNKAKIETSVPIGVRDEEVEVHGKSDCDYFGRRRCWVARS